MKTPADSRVVDMCVSDDIKIALEHMSAPLAEDESYNDSVAVIAGRAWDRIVELESALTAAQDELEREKAFHQNVNATHSQTLREMQRSLTAEEKRIAEAVYQEREACRAIANAVGDKADGGHSLGYRSAGWEIAELIKARGKS